MRKRKRDWEEEKQLRFEAAKLFAAKLKPFLNQPMTTDLRDRLADALYEGYQEFWSTHQFEGELPKFFPKPDPANTHQMLIEPINEPAKWIMSLATALGVSPLAALL